MFVILLLYLCSEILDSFTEVPTYVRVLAFAFIFVLYEPLFVSYFGATIGHSRFNLEVRSLNDEQKKINFLQALVRYLFKMLLGWLSLLTIGSTEKKTAIHDGVVRSVVLSIAPQESQ